MKRLITLGSFVWHVFLDYLFPRAESIVHLEHMTAEEMRDTFPTALWSTPTGYQAIFAYQHSGVRSLIWQIKYNRNQKLIETTGQLLAEETLPLLAEKSIDRPGKTVLLVPIPISQSRARERGYNQSELLARALIRAAPDLPVRLATDVLVKARETAHQTKTSNRQERLKNLQGSFACPDPTRLRGTTVILVDDVITTGATMREASETLRRAGAKDIFCISVAH